MSRIYIGNLPIDIRESELDDLFYKYGKIREIDLKTPARPPAFAFISFDDYRDAEDAVRGRDGYNFDGYRLRVEFAKGDRNRGRYEDRAPRRGGGRRTDYGITVSNLPRGCSWQDLKDFMRKAGDVVYADIDKYGDGTVEFSNRDDMEYAIRSLDDTLFKNHNDSSYIRIKSKSGGKRGSSEDRSVDDRRRSRSRSRSRSSSHSRSRSRDRAGKRDRAGSEGSGDRSERSRDRSASRERSPARDEEVRSNEDRNDARESEGGGNEDDKSTGNEEQN